MIITETERLLLRNFHIGDTAAMREVLCDPEVMTFSGGVKAPEEVEGWIENCNHNCSTLGFGLWAVVMKDTKEVIGYCGLTRFQDIDGKPETEIGFRLARKFWFHGYAMEIAKAVRDHAFGVLSIPRLIALVDPANTASIRVVEKIGMTYEKDVMLPWYDHPDRLYATSQHKKDG